MQSFYLDLKIMNDDLVFSVDFGLIVLFANADAIVKLFYHSASLAVKVIYVCILDRDPCSVSFSDTVNYSIQVGRVGIGFLFLGLFLMRHQ